MTKLLIVGLTSVILFGLSGTASWYFQHQKELEHQQAEKPASPGTKTAGPIGKLDHSSSKIDTHAGGESNKIAARPAFSAGADEFLKANADLRTRVAEVRESERLVNSRTQQLELIKKDIQGERTAIDDLQKQVKKELEAVQAALAELEKQKASVKNDQSKASKAAQDLKGLTTQLEKEELEKLKKMAPFYNSMSPEGAAKILKEFADTGRIETAAKVLLMMQGKQGSKVLDELKDPVLAAQLLDKLKSLRSPATAPDLR